MSRRKYAGINKEQRKATMSVFSYLPVLFT